MLGKNEKIAIDSAWFESREDSWEEGEIPDSRGASWNMRDVGLDRGEAYDSVEAALKAVCEANCFEFEKSRWEPGPEPGTFETSFMVDDDNCEATKSQIEVWKKNEERLWCCSAVVRLAVVSKRELTEDESKI